MHTDKDPGKNLDVGTDTEEENNEKNLQWLIDMDLSEPEETLFTVKDDEYQDEGLSAFESEVAGRPLVRGNDAGDDLASYVGEEIVISSEGASDIYNDNGAEDDSDAAEARPESMALDFSRGREQSAGQQKRSVDEGTDILGLQNDDDIGETYLTLKRVKGAANTAESENAPSTEAPAETLAMDQPLDVVTPEVEASAVEPVAHEPEILDAVAATADESVEPVLSEAPEIEQVAAAEDAVVANDPIDDAVTGAMDADDPLGGASSLADAAKLLDEPSLPAQTDEPVMDEVAELDDAFSFDLEQEFDGFADAQDEVIDLPEEVEAIAAEEDNEALAMAAVIPSILDTLNQQVAARAVSLAMTADAVRVDVMMGMDEDSIRSCYSDGYVPLSAMNTELPQAIEAVSDAQAESIFVKFSGSIGQENWNHFFSDTFEPPAAEVEVVDESTLLSDTGSELLIEADPMDDLVSGMGEEMLADTDTGFAVVSELEDFIGSDTDAEDDIFGADFDDDLGDDFAADFAGDDEPLADIDAVFSEIDMESDDSEPNAAEEAVAGQVEPETIEAVSAEPVEVVEPVEAESVEDDPVALEPVELESPEVESLEAESPEVESPEVESLEVEEAPVEASVADESVELVDDSANDPVNEGAVDSGLALTAMIGATDATNPDWYTPAAIKFSFTTQSNAEIFADFLDAFIEEGSAEIEKLENLIGEWEKDVSAEAHYADVCRTLHTVKGIAKGVGLQRMGTLVHNFETLLESLPRPEEGEELLYFRVVNIWLDAVVRGIEHITNAREDIQSELPRVGKPAAELAAETVEPEVEADVEVEVEAEAEAETKQAKSKGKGSAKKSGAKAKAKTKAKTKTKAKSKTESKPEPKVETPDETVAEEQVPGAEAQVSMLAALEKKRDKQIADEGAKVLAAQQSVRMTSEKLDLLLNLASQAQQLGVRASQNTTRSKRSSSELQGRLTSVRTHINKIADRALFNVNARAGGTSAEMDALEMDQYSELQEAASILREGVEDLSDLIDVVSRQNAQVEALLKQQSSVISSISSSIQGARVVPVSRLMPGLRRIVRTVSADLGKSVTFNVVNETGALDRDHYARLQTVLEHMVRNALDHGIESADDRLAAGKPMGGRITIDVRKSGGDYIIRLSDDGKGIDADAIRQSAYEKGLDVDVDELSDDEAIRLIFHKGFSTASELSEISGRGVGMDIVLSELQQIGGDITIQSAVGLGTSFEVRIPSNVSVNGALLVAAADQSYAIPLNGLVAVEQVPVDEFFKAIDDGRSLDLFDIECEPAYLGTLCHSVAIPDRTFWDAFVPVIIAGSNNRHMAIAIDNVEEALELVVRSLGSQFSTVPGVAGAATTSDGEALVALDLNLLVASIGADGVAAVGKVEHEERQSLLALVVDDSRTQRMVATSQLESVGVETITAENGLVAIDLLNATHRLPDVVLLDVEMPVKDGIETLREIRKSRRYGQLPVIMVTSRTGAKHRALAKEAGCNAYMGKPFNFPALIEQISELTGHALELS